MRQMEIQVVAAEVRALSSNNALQPTCTASRCFAVHSLAALGAAERGRCARTHSAVERAE